MSILFDPVLGVRPRARKYTIRPLVLAAAPLVALLWQIYTPLFFTPLAFLELPLLVTVYFGLMRRSPVAGILIGAGIGLAQDALSHNPLGMFGIVKTLVGYFAAYASQRFEVENNVVRFLLGSLFYFSHQLLYCALANMLLAQPLAFDFPQTVLLALLNGAVTAPLYALLDRL